MGVFGQNFIQIVHKSFDSLKIYVNSLDLRPFKLIKILNPFTEILTQFIWHTSDFRWKYFFGFNNKNNIFHIFHVKDHKFKTE